MSYADNLSKRYQETSVNTASGAQLVVLLYEGAIQSLKKAIAGINDKNLEAKHEAVDRALGIIQHLQATLDMKRGGQIAADLDRLYTYMTSRILDGSSKLEIAPLQEVVKLLTPMLEAWEEVAKRKNENSVTAKAMMAGQEGSTIRLQLHG
jgi:flagellar protein FliS